MLVSTSIVVVVSNFLYFASPAPHLSFLPWSTCFAVSNGSWTVHWIHYCRIRLSLLCLLWSYPYRPYSVLSVPQTICILPQSSWWQLYSWLVCLSCSLWSAQLNKWFRTHIPDRWPNRCRNRRSVKTRLVPRRGSNRPRALWIKLPRNQEHFWLCAVFCHCSSRHRMWSYFGTFSGQVRCEDQHFMTPRCEWKTRTKVKLWIKMNYCSSGKFFPIVDPETAFGIFLSSQQYVCSSGNASLVIFHTSIYLKQIPFSITSSRLWCGLLIITTAHSVRYLFTLVENAYTNDSLWNASRTTCSSHCERIHSTTVRRSCGADVGKKNMATINERMSAPILTSESTVILSPWVSSYVAISADCWDLRFIFSFFGIFIVIAQPVIQQPKRNVTDLANVYFPHSLDHRLTTKIEYHNLNLHGLMQV